MESSPLSDRLLWRQALMELLGTSVFLFLVTSILITGDDSGGGVYVARVSFGIGLSIGVLAHVFGPISGGHFNPAVTLGAMVTGDCGVVKGLVYFTAQIIGGIIGSAVTFGLHPSPTHPHIDRLRLGDGYSEVQGLFIELLLTSLLVFTALASSSSDNNRKDLGFVNPLAVGLSITVAHLVGIPATGSGINPARAFGPSLVVNNWQSYHWIYWIGPLGGAVCAGIVYRFTVRPETTQDDEPGEMAPLMTSYKNMDEESQVE